MIGRSLFSKIETANEKSCIWIVCDLGVWRGSGAKVLLVPTLESGGVGVKSFPVSTVRP